MSSTTAPRFYLRRIGTRAAEDVVVYAALDAPAAAGHVATIGHYPPGWRPVENAPGEVLYEPGALQIWLADVTPAKLEPPHAEPIGEDDSYAIAPRLRGFVEDALESLRETGKLPE